jgi:[FeFe] hydrogenase H-cluster maturation GTPase HydF
MAKGRESKPHIGIFGRRNNGKSSLINTLAGQDIAIVSDVAGTTTDPVKKSIEIHGIGPVIMVDTAGIDDTGELGLKRIARTEAALKTIDLAILVVVNNAWDDHEEGLVEKFRENDIPFFVVHNKADIQPAHADFIGKIRTRHETSVVDFSAAEADRRQVELLVDLIRRLMPESALRAKTIVGDLIKYGDVVLLITPIDIEAPEGRLILPQVQVIRDVLDHDGVAVVVKEREVDTFFKQMNPKPALVVTDSQVFLKADASIPKEIPLTSFSILLARQRGDFENYLKGTPKIGTLSDGDRVLILESCTHHVSCDDIGRMKIPRWLTNYTGKKLEFDVVAGLSSLPRDITDYAIVIQCGGCVITRKQLINRLKPAVDAGIPVTNYGMAIAFVHGIYNRAVAPFLKSSSNAVDYL